MTVDRFDAVVIGSGFGGAVMAQRLSEAGLSVCVLERGKPYAPGSFPRAPHEMARNFWDPDEHLFGLFDVRSFRGKLWSIVSSGLGGGSLIYAGALHRMDEPDADVWPITRSDLDPHYDRVERMLSAQPYPFASGAPYDSTPKTRAIKESAERLGLPWELQNLGISFSSDGCKPGIGMPIHQRQDLHRSQRFTCRLCAECNLGCNHGSKNSLDFNYLSEARSYGAEIRALADAQEIAPLSSGGYVIRYVQHEAGERGPTSSTASVEIHAKQLILAAGTFGTTDLLLRNRTSFPSIGQMLGQRFSGNGNLLTFAMHAHDGESEQPRNLEPWRGPVITSAVRVPANADDGTSGFYVEDAGYPLFLTWVLESARPSMLARLGRFAFRRRLARLIGSPNNNLGRSLADAIGQGELSCSSMPLLGIGRDDAGGVLSLRHGALDVDWPNGRSREYDDRVRETARAIAGVWGAELRDNPFPGLNRRVTVHPLGGCPMGRHEHEGVVDPQGQVFGYPGLYVADGSVMPGPIGANPSLTIAALSDRFADGIIEDARTDLHADKRPAFVAARDH